MMNSERFLQAYILSSNFLKTSFSKNFFIALHPNDGVTKLFTPTVGKTSFGDTFTVNVADVNEINGVDVKIDDLKIFRPQAYLE
ncbi:uncharacterized protein OCT59_002486 [Rhizophagus irregularis]|uniref:uncharacterized protein n=1 Tax=Rhizophagus irregularis TaxID=588596 RepID=UPI00331F8D4E|nr:hypothetical protein OCT59_002486 [Rhizophagus irregularis]